MAKWKRFDSKGVEKIRSAKHGVIYKLHDGIETEIVAASEIFENDSLWYSKKITHYLICKPHKHAEMICRWARTGQPVYVKASDGIWYKCDSNWFIEKEYSFNQQKTKIQYRDYLCRDSVGKVFKETLNKQHSNAEEIEDRDSFIRWIHDDWQEMEVVTKDDC